MSRSLSIEPLPMRRRDAEEFRIPASKSHAARALVLAHLSGRRTEVENPSPARDAATLDAALRELEAAHGRGATLSMGDGGAPARFVLAVAAMTPGEWCIEGSPRLEQRPMQPLVDALRALGASIDFDGRWPIRVRGTGLRGGDVECIGIDSSQFTSALMLLATRISGGLDIRHTGLVSLGYLDLTAELIRRFGGSAHVEIGSDHRTIRIAEGLTPPSRLRLPADASGASFALALGALLRSHIPVAVDRGDAHPDWSFLDVLQSMGVVIHHEGDHAWTQGAPLRGGEFDLASFPDAAPALAVVAAGSAQPVTVTGAAHLELKESRRITDLAAGLNLLGVHCEPRADGFRIVPTARESWKRGVTIPVHGDHRLAMAFATLGAVHPLSIDDGECVGKSFPGFFDELGRHARVTMHDA